MSAANGSGGATSASPSAARAAAADEQGTSPDAEIAQVRRSRRQHDLAVTVAAELYGGRMRERPDAVRKLMHDQSRSARAAATCSSRWRVSAGPASPACPSSGSRR